jgi:hypothetical protein
VIASAAAIVAAGGTLSISLASTSSEAPVPGIIQAESFAAQSGAQLEGTADNGGGKNVGWLASGDWMRYDGVNVGQPGQLTTTIRVAAATDAGGAVELHADTQGGPLLASFTIGSTGGWQRWVTLTDRRDVTLAGSHNVFIVLRSDQHADFVNINWFSFSVGMGASPPGSVASSNPATPAASSAATAAPMPSSAPPPVATGWVAVDPAEQAAKTAAFFARTPSPVTGNPVKVPEFHATCLVSHHGDNDPIVFPGLAGASHNHTFWGNTATNENTTAASLRTGATTCNPKEDRSGYWIPTLYQNGRVVDPTEVTVYYGSRLKDPSRTQPFPFGLRMIEGDAKKQSDPHGNHFWCAGIGGEVGRSADGVFPVCAATAHLVRQIMFPDCWDGKHLDSPNHKDHMADMIYTATCPSSHPVPTPSVSFVIGYPLSGDTNGITLSSGNSYSMHADFFNGWDEDALAARVRNCLDQHVKCNAAGGF